MKTVRWFALLAAATVPASMVLPATAFATPGVNIDAATISQSTVDGVDYITREITIQPGGSTGWHYHDARVFGVVREGTLTRTMADCTDVVVVGLNRDAGAGRRGQHLLNDVLAQRRFTGQFDRVAAVEAGGAQPRGRLLGGRDHIELRNVAPRVVADRVPHGIEHLALVLCIA